jgi:hypothetical protein
MPKTVNLALFWTQDAVRATPRPGMSSADLAKNYIDAARLRFQMYGLALQTYPDSSDPKDGQVLNWPTTINIPQHDLNIRRMAHGVRPVGKGIPVIFTTLNEASRFPLKDDGTPMQVMGWVPDKDDAKEKFITDEWLPFVFINVQRSGIGYPLAHELGHAAGLDHVLGADGRKESGDMKNIMYYADWFSASQFTKDQVETISKAYFVDDH